MTTQVYSKDAATKTHGAIDGSFVDMLMPHTELVGTTSNLLRSGIYGVIGWLARGYKDNGKIGF